MNRREFLLKSTTAAGLAAATRLRLGAATTTGSGRGVALVIDPTDPVASTAPARWAVNRLRDALAAHGWDVRLVARPNEARSGDRCIVACAGASGLARDAGVRPPDAPESLALAPARLGTRDVLLATGSDARGLAYALGELTDAIEYAAGPAAVAATLAPARPVFERPANSVRSVMRLFVSDVADKGWFNDRKFWREYLTMLASLRFNRVNLSFGLGYDSPRQVRDAYFYFAYPFLVSVPGYDVQATNLPAAERDRNLEMLRFISDEAAARGMQFQLGLWTHAYELVDSPDASHVITGLTPQTHAPYVRDALALVLRECPNITGFTVRIHGESGIREGSYDLWQNLFAGAARCGRPVEIDLHAKGLNQEIIGIGLATGLPVKVSPKFSAEHLGLPYHQASIRPTEMPSFTRTIKSERMSVTIRGFLRYGYGDLLTEDRPYGLFHRIWPGTNRLLLWGDPSLISAYSRAGGFCGSLGQEIIDPLAFNGRQACARPGSRDGYADPELSAPGGDFEKYRYTYRLWGRLLYNPDAEPETWQRQLRADYGTDAALVESGLACTSRILPLITTTHLPSAANSNFWVELPSNFSIVDATPPEPNPYPDTPQPKRYGGVSPLDPQLFYRVEDYVDDLLKDTVSGKYTPLEVAGWLADLAERARPSFDPPAAPTDNAARRYRVDAGITTGLGRFFSEKNRAAVLFALFERTGATAALDAAVVQYRAVRAAWNDLCEKYSRVYANDLTYGPLWFQHGNWRDRLADIDADIARMEQKKFSPPPANASALSAGRIAVLVDFVAKSPTARSLLARSGAGISHASPGVFHRGATVTLSLATVASGPTPQSARLFYRHANQSEEWQSVAMIAEASGFHASIPAGYTDSAFPLAYYFEVGATVRTLFPGFVPTLDNQPYYVLRAAR